jgi:phosphoglucosamine mutase
MEKRKLFGTDGIRGPANQSFMTPEVLVSIGEAIGYALRRHIKKKQKKLERRARIVLGKDTRLSGYMVEFALTSGICSMGVDVLLIGPIPTPGVAFVTQSMRADAGVMISASHNPYYDNGIKIFLEDGFKIPDLMERQIEKLVGSSVLLKNRAFGPDVGRVHRVDDVYGRCLVYLKSFFPKSLDLSGLRIVLDCANGAAYKLAPLVFEELGAEVIKLGVHPDGVNINDKCGALFPETMAAMTVQYRAEMGISLDGDGDRCILSDEHGQIVDGDQMIGLCALQMAQAGQLNDNTVVTTPMSNMGLELTLKKRGISMLRSRVGDRHVIEMMRAKGLNLGGEQSGHIVFLDHATTGDGVVAALKVLEVMKRTGKSLSELKKEIQLFPQAKKDLHVSKKVPLEKLPEVVLAIEKVKKTLGSSGRVFVRYSGTEPLIRILLEGQDAGQIQELCQFLFDVLDQNLN